MVLKVLSHPKSSWNSRISCRREEKGEEEEKEEEEEEEGSEGGTNPWKS